MSTSTPPGWLARQNAADIAALLNNRPDALIPPTPRNLRQLAGRLDTEFSLKRAFNQLDYNCHQIGQALQLLGDGTALADLAAITQDSPLLAATLATLRDFALAWPCDQQCADCAEHHLHITPGLGILWEAPLGLGPPALALLELISADELRKIARQLGVAPGRTRQTAAEAIASALAERDTILTVTKKLPADAQELLELLVHQSPFAHTPPLFVYGRSWDSFLDAEQHEATNALLAYGLLIRCAPETAVLPLEVGVALRGELSVALRESPLTHIGLVPVARTVSPEAEHDVGSAPAMAAVDMVERLGTIAGHQPISELKKGGVGKQQLRRLAVALDCSEVDLPLWIDIAYYAQLITSTEDGLTPTTHFDAWLDQDVAARWSELLRTWLNMPQASTWRFDALTWNPDDPGKPDPPPQLGPGLVDELRRAVLGVLADLPTRSALPTIDALEEVLGWQWPALLSFRDAAHHQLIATMHEAELLGLTTGVALTGLGRLAATAPSAVPSATLATAAAAFFPELVTKVALQADLTAVAIGPPHPRVAALLNSIAQAETTGTARTWRFSPESIRAALDAGRSSDELRTELAAVALSGIPQPLAYLINDIARKHGNVRVAAASSCIVCDDGALLGELVHHKALQSLGLRQLAPTVLLSTQPMTETLHLLRTAGYAPAGETACGGHSVEKPQVHRAPMADESAETLSFALTVNPPIEIDIHALAEQLLAAPSDDSASELAGTLVEWTPHLNREEQRIIADAAEEGRSIVISYLNNAGHETTRPISQLELSPPYLSAWCHLRDAERMFALERITAVIPI